MKTGSNRGRRSATDRPAQAGSWPSGPEWRLPSGRLLAEFALESGFVVPSLLSGGLLGGWERAEGLAGSQRSREGRG